MQPNCDSLRVKGIHTCTLTNAFRGVRWLCDFPVVVVVVCLFVCLFVCSFVRSFVRFWVCLFCFVSFRFVLFRHTVAPKIRFRSRWKCRAEEIQMCTTSMLPSPGGCISISAGWMLLLCKESITAGDSTHLNWLCSTIHYFYVAMLLLVSVCCDPRRDHWRKLGHLRTNIKSDHSHWRKISIYDGALLLRAPCFTDIIISNKALKENKSLNSLSCCCLF